MPLWEEERNEVLILKTNRVLTDQEFNSLRNLIEWAQMEDRRSFMNLPVDVYVTQLERADHVDQRTPWQRRQEIELNTCVETEAVDEAVLRQEQEDALCFGIDYDRPMILPMVRLDSTPDEMMLAYLTCHWGERMKASNAFAGAPSETVQSYSGVGQPGAVGGVPSGGTKLDQPKVSAPTNEYGKYNLGRYNSNAGVVIITKQPTAYESTYTYRFGGSSKVYTATELELDRLDLKPCNLQG